MSSSLPDPADLCLGEDSPDTGRDGKAEAALARFRIERVTMPEGAPFEEAYRALEGEFAPRGEIERREVIAMWLHRAAASRPRRLTTAAPRSAELTHHYHLLAARDDAGALAGVRDCHITIDAERQIAVAYLAHTLVLPAHRRTGLAALLRAAPITLARRAILEDLGADAPGCELLLAAEMDPAERDLPATVIRLVAYGHAGFKAVAPRHLPYCQPDFRDLAGLRVPAQPLPMLAIVRRIGHEREDEIPAPLAETFVTHLYAVFATHARAEDLHGPLARARGRLVASGLERVPLLPLPSATDDAAALEPLWRSAVLAFHPHEPERS